MCFFHLVQFPLSYNSHSSLVVIRNLTKRCVVKNLENLPGNKSHRLICVWSWDDSFFVLAPVCKSQAPVLPMQKHRAFLRNIFFLSLQFFFLPPFYSAFTLTKTHRKGMSAQKKAPHNCNTASSSDQLELCKEACQQCERRGVQPPSASSVITSLSPAASASLVEFIVTLMNFLLRLHLSSFHIDILWQLLCAQN